MNTVLKEDIRINVSGNEALIFLYTPNNITTRIRLKFREVNEYWVDLEQEKYPKYCTFKNGVFKITNQKKFGSEVLSGVPLSSENEAYLIKTKVPLNCKNISMPSVVNGGAYPAYFVSGGKLLSGQLETTVVLIKINIPKIIDAKGISGITDNGIEYFVTLLK